MFVICLFRAKQQVLEEIKYMIKEEAVEAKPKAHVDRQFFKQLTQLMRICVPGWTSPEAGLLVVVAASLVARTMCDLWMINHSTKIER